MPLYRRGANVIFFVHIPKAGGSTVEETLVGLGAKQALKHHKRLGYASATPQHMHREVFERFVPRAFYDWAFTVVRNPYARIISEYRWRSKVSEKDLPPFEAWVRESIAAATERPYLYDNHMRPQVEFTAKWVQVFKLEDGLQAPIAAACRKLGLEPPSAPPHRAKESGGDPLTLSRRALGAIEEFYRSDFDTFGYSVGALPPALILA